MRHALHCRDRTTGALAAAFAAALLGCASATPPAPAPAQIPALEARVARDSSDVDAMVQLGAAYRQVGRTAEARWLLERALARRPDDAQIALYLGLTYEDHGDFSRARELYGRYVASEAAPGMRDVQRRIRARLPLLARRELEAAVRSAVSREAELAGTEPSATRIAVFPFLYEGADPELRPLGRALAELLTTDLSQVQRLTVLERARVQLLLDELELAESGYVDPRTAARGGRLLGAGRIVQGRISGGSDGVELEATVVRVTTSEVPSAVRERDDLRRLFDLEKRLALALFESLGVQLTPAERERVNRRPTESLRALLEFGLGLEAEDAGDYARAAMHYGRALEADPEFAPAAERRDRAQDISLAAAETTRQLGALAGGMAAGFGGVPDLEQVLDAVLRQVPTPSGRDAAAEILGQEGLGQRSVIEIILRPPVR